MPVSIQHLFHCFGEKQQKRVPREALVINGLPVEIPHFFCLFPFLNKHSLLYGFTELQHLLSTEDAQPGFRYIEKLHAGTKQLPYFQSFRTQMPKA